MPHYMNNIWTYAKVSILKRVILNVWYQEDRLKHKNEFVVFGFRSRLIDVKYTKIPGDIYTFRCVYFETHMYILVIKIKLNIS